jgi:hypothetical protein
LAKVISYLRSAAIETSDQPPLIHASDFAEERVQYYLQSFLQEVFPSPNIHCCSLFNLPSKLAIRGSGSFLLIWGEGTLSFERIVVIFEKSVKVRTGGPKVGSQEAGWQSSDETET